MRIEVKIAGLKYHDVEKLRVENPDYNLTSKVIRECFSEGDKIFRYEYPREPVEVALEPENPYDDTALAVYVAGKQVGYVAKEQKQKVFDLHHQDVKVWAEIDGGPVKVVGDGRVFNHDYPLMGHLIFSGNVEPKEIPQPAPEPEKKKKISPQVWLILGFIIILGYLAISFFYPIPGVVGIVFGLAVLSRGVKERKEQRNDERRKR